MLRRTLPKYKITHLVQRAPNSWTLSDFDLAAPPIVSHGIGLLTSYTEDCIKAMMSTPAVIDHVPFQPRAEAAAVLKQHFEKRPRTGTRYFLICNSGPKGSGKTTVMSANCLQMMKERAVVIYVEYGSGQSTAEDQADLSKFAKPKPSATEVFRIMTNARTLSHFIDGGWQDGIYGRICKDLFNDDKVRMMETLRSYSSTLAMVKKELKGAADTRSIFLAIDEFAMGVEFAAWPIEDPVRIHQIGVDCLSDLAAFMDSTLKKPNKADHVYLAVSVHDVVDLFTFATKSNRALLHQQLHPLWWFDSKAADAMPISMRFFFKGAKNAPPPTDAAEVGRLLIESGGHPRRVSALFGECERIGRQEQLRLTDDAVLDRRVVGDAMKLVAQQANSIRRLMDDTFDFADVNPFRAVKSNPPDADITKIVDSLFVPFKRSYKVALRT